MFSDENKSSALAKYLNTFDYAIIDTCSLMDEAFPEWMDVLHNAKDYRKKELEILVPYRCYDELKNHARQRKDDSKRIAAKRGLKILKKAKWHHLLAITKKDKTENFADNAIYVNVSTNRLFSKILIITQDKKLASDLLALNSLKSQSGRFLEVCKLVNGGKLVPNRGEDRPVHRERTPEKPIDKKPSKPAAPTVDSVLAADARLSAVIGNPNYPFEKKKQDAEAQIRAIESLPESTRAQLSLLVPLPRLRELAKGNVTKKGPAPKTSAKPAPKPAETPAESAKEKLWYGVGKTPKEGFMEVAKHYGIMFRSPSVAYFPAAHGPFDLTEEDLRAIVSLALEQAKGEEKVDFTYRGLPLSVQKAGDVYRCFIDVNNLPKSLTPTKKAAPAPKPAEAPEAPKPAPKEKLWYGTGSSMEDGFRDCANHYGIIFREMGVSYEKETHGPIDLTVEDLRNIATLGTSLLRGDEKISFLYRGLTLLTQKFPEKFKCWIDVNLLPEKPLPLSKSDRPKENKPIPEAKAEETMSETPKPRRRNKPVPKTEESPVPETGKEPAPAKKSTPKRKKPTVESPDKAEPVVEEKAKSTPKPKSTRRKSVAKPLDESNPTQKPASEETKTRTPKKTTARRPRAKKTTPKGSEE